MRFLFWGNLIFTDMFYQIQFNDIQNQIARLIASMKTDLDKYAATENANAASVEIRERILNQLNDYHEYNNNLYVEFRQQQQTDFSAGFNEGYKKAQHEYEPHLRVRTSDKELDRFNSKTRAMETWPELY